MNSIEAENDPDYEKNEMKVISQVGALSYVYDFDENSDYYVTYANTMIKDEEYKVQDWAFAYNDFSGRSLDGCIYDNETGLLYIQKALYDQLNEEEGGEGLAMMSLQVQFMQVYYDKDTMEGLTETEVPDMQSDVCTVDVNEDESAIDVNTDTQDIFSLETTTTVSAGMDARNLNVAVNGMIVPDEVYEYDPGTGSLTVEMSPASVVSVEAWEGEKTVQEQLIDLTAGDVQALTYKSMKPLGVVKLNSKAAVQKITKDDRIMKLYGTLTYKNSATHATGDEPYYITADGPGDYMDANIRLANWLTDQSKTLSYANIKPNYIGPGSDMYIGSNLSNYKLVNKDQKWIHNYSKFLKKIKIQSTCMHIERAYLGESGASNKARFNVRIVKVHKGEVKKKTSGKTTTYKQNGYIVFGLLSPKICKQTTCNLLKVKFEASWKTTTGGADDPFRLFLYKAEDGAEDGMEEDGVSESTFPYASLGNAVFTVKYFPDVEYSTLKEIENSGKKPKCTWTFVTKDYGDAGSEVFQDRGSKVSDKYNTSGGVEVAGIEFNALDASAPRSEWENDFIMPKDLESWQKNFGKKGTYLIQETTPPGGFLNEGEMFPSGKPDSVKAPGKGSVVYTEPNTDPAKRILKVNGKKVVQGEIITSNLPREAIIVKEKADKVKMWSNASFPENGSQYMKTSNPTVQVKDSIKIQAAQIKKGIYKLTTALKIQGEDQFVTVDWDAIPNSTVRAANPAAPECIDVTLSTTEASTGSKTITPGSLVTVEVSGTISVDGLVGKKLVFINSLQVIDEEKHISSIVDDDFGDYITDEEGDPDDEEGEENNEADGNNDIWLESDEDDPAETLSFDEEGHASTQIISSQIQRKSGTGESIAYAGMYKDETCKEGGGSVLQSMTDTIEYSGLTPNKSYTIKGWLVDLETNEKAKDAAGNEIKITDGTSQTASATGSGTWDVHYKFDGTGLDGKKFVSFIEIYDGSTLAFEFKNKDDKYESFMIPSVQTQLTDQDTGTNLTAAGNSLLVDTITYKNLLPGLRYKIVSRLVDAETGDVGLDKNGNPMQCETYEIAEGESGSFDIELAFQINKSNGKKYVAFEEIFLEKGSPGSGEWVLVADHKDVMDKNQRTVVPSIKTFAKDQKTDHHLSYPEHSDLK